MNINVYALATPALLILCLSEFAYCLYRRNGYYNFQDTLANFATGIGNQVVNVFVAWVIYLAYGWAFERFAPVRLGGSLGELVVLFLAIDFLFYWFHRAGHTFKVMWAAHSPHHSSEELNYSVAIRSSVTQRAASFLFYLPLALVGYPPEVLLPAVVFHHLMQFWPHTRAIGRLPRWFEAVFNSPTHHRIHHAINDQYLDKNFGGVLIVWDKLFGSYAPEVEAPIFGVRPTVKTWDPVAVNLAYYKTLWREAREAPRWIDKLLVWFMPLGWRPRGLAPLGPTWNKATHRKYETPLDPGVKIYLLAQLAPTLAVMMLVSSDASPLSPLEKAALGLCLWITVIGWGGFLENKDWAVGLERARLLLMPVCLVWILSPGEPLSLLALGIWAAALKFFALLWFCTREKRAFAVALR